MCDISNLDESDKLSSDSSICSAVDRGVNDGGTPVCRGLAIAGSLAASCARSRTRASRRQPQHQQQLLQASPSRQFFPTPLPQHRIRQAASNAAVAEDQMYSADTVADLLDLLRGSNAPHLARFRDFLLDKNMQNFSGEIGLQVAQSAPRRQPLGMRNDNKKVVASGKENAGIFSSVLLTKNKSTKKPRHKSPSIERRASAISPPTPPPPPQPSVERTPPKLQQAVPEPAQQQPPRSSNGKRRSASYPALLTDLATSIRAHLSSRSATSADLNGAIIATDLTTSSSVVEAIEALTQQASAIGQLLDRLDDEAKRLNEEKQRLVAAVAGAAARFQRESQQQQQQAEPVRSEISTSTVGSQTDLAWEDVEQTMAEEREQYALQIDYLNYELAQLSERFEQIEFDKLELSEKCNTVNAAARGERAAFEERLRELEAEISLRETRCKELEAKYSECKYRTENCEFLMSLRNTKLNNLRAELQTVANQMKDAVAMATANDDANSDSPAAAVAIVTDACERLRQMVTDSLEDALCQSVLKLCAEVKSN